MPWGVFFEVFLCFQRWNVKISLKSVFFILSCMFFDVFSCLRGCFLRYFYTFVGIFWDISMLSAVKCEDFAKDRVFYTFVGVFWRFFDDNRLFGSLEMREPNCRFLMFFNVVFEVDHTPIALRVFEDDLGDITLNLRSEIALNLVYDVSCTLFMM